MWTAITLYCLGDNYKKDLNLFTTDVSILDLTTYKWTRSGVGNAQEMRTRDWGLVKGPRLKQKLHIPCVHGGSAWYSVMHLTQILLFGTSKMHFVLYLDLLLVQECGTCRY